MAIPQYSSLAHWYSARSDRQTSALSTRIDDASGKAAHGTRIGTAITQVADWFNLGETTAGGDNGILPPSLAVPTGTYSWLVRVRRSNASNWPASPFPIIIGDTNNTGRCITYADGGGGYAFNTGHSAFGSIYFWGTAADLANWVTDASHNLAFSYNASTTTGQGYFDGSAFTPSTTLAANSSGGGNIKWLTWGTTYGWGHEVSDMMIWPGVALTSGEFAAALAYFDIVVSSVSPADGATGVSTTDPLVITCSVVPTIGSGNYVIKRSADDSVFQTIAASSTSVVGSTIEIPHTAFAGGTGYYVERDAFAVAGIGALSGATAWNFTTAGGAVSGPAITSSQRLARNIYPRRMRRAA